MRNLITVLLAGFSAACTTPAKELPGPPSAEAAAPGPTTAASSPAVPAASPSASAPLVASAAASAGRAGGGPPPSSPTGSAYFGCGTPIPTERLWDETTEGEVLEAISVAKECAGAQKRKLLLEFVAPWCGDCREMARLDETPIVSETLRKRFERVRINVGKWDRHEALRESYKVKALATYVVIDPKTSKVLTQTTLEPVSKKQSKKLTAEDWAAWLARH